MVQLENIPLSRCVTLLSRSCHGPMTKLYEEWSMTKLYEEWPMTKLYEEWSMTKLYEEWSMTGPY